MKKALLILFVLIPSLVTASILASPDNALSSEENRPLITRNAISSHIADGSFQSDLENYLSDQFPLRDRLVYAQCLLRYALGQRDINGAYIGKDGRLLQKIIDSDIPKDALFAYADKMNRVAERTPVYALYVPSAGAVDREALPAGAPMYDYPALYAALSARLNKAVCIDMSQYLDSGKYYYKTDHHWNADGAYQAYAAFCLAKGETPKAQAAFNLKSVCTDFRGTLYAKVRISPLTDEILLPDVAPVTVTADGQAAELYRYDALQTADQYNVFLGGNHGVTEITGTAGNGKTLLVFKDSFANSFVPYIVDQYAKIILIDERYTFISAEDYVNQTNPDEVLILREIVH